jgi:hypothetical protein
MSLEDVRAGCDPTLEKSIRDARLKLTRCIFALQQGSVTSAERAREVGSVSQGAECHLASIILSGYLLFVCMYIVGIAIIRLQ